MDTAPAFASVSEAMDMARAALGYLAATDATQLGAATQARCLKMIEQADAIGTAARASFLAAFTAGQGCRSAAAQAKASGQHDAAGHPYRSFRGLLEHLATLPRNQVRFAGATASVPMLTEPTSAQREAFDLIGVPIPLLLK
jgi:hypothetical protein